MYLTEELCNLIDVDIMFDNLIDQEMVTSSKSLEWIDAMSKKIKSIEKKKVWVLVDLPENKNIGCKWILKKYKIYGSMDKFKIRLVAKDFSKRVN